MKKVILLVLVILLYTCNSSDDSNDSTNSISTDISVTSSVSSITWFNSDDLNQQLENALTYNYRSAQENEIEIEQIFNWDISQVCVSIRFKAAFQSIYNDPNSSNNLVVINLVEDISNQAVQLKAGGPGNTYELITSVLAPGHNPIETPDCSHNAFGNHIGDIFDNELNTNVFRFYIHTSLDNDRCINFDR